MASISFFDTCALQHKYVDGPHSRRIRQIIGGVSRECFVAEWTVLEIASAFANRCRAGNFQIDVFDRWELKFYPDIADRRLNVRPVSQRNVLKARQLIRFAGVLNRRNLASGDALIASTCLELALERRKTVTFYTSDWTLYTIVRDIDVFKFALRMVYVGAPKGGIPALSGRTRV